MRIVFIVAVGFALDMMLGDPRWLPHPICLIGKLIAWLEKKIRAAVKSDLCGGVLLAVIVLACCYCVPFFILFASGKVSSYFSLALETLFCYTIFAARSLKTESMKVYYPLVKGEKDEAKKFLSYIVGRDTGKLDESGIIKATVETVAENTTDGVVAPLLFMVIGGAPLAFLYKGINTMDSMIGYKNEKYIRFGKFAARLDDAANYIPARISAFFMIISSAIIGLDYKNAFKIYLRDRKNHKSPNSAQTESVCAGALNIQLAGNAYYFGEFVQKPTIGDGNRKIEPGDIILANRLMYMTSILTVIVALTVRGVLWWIM
ncbi:MAG: cobalamin biosynthesis protein CobD [Clostridiaceae bacterium]|nr:cobalamin biosynthesis protein CobD [Clostridiaceae bacterium]